MAVNFESVFNALKSGIVTLAETDLKGYITEANHDGQAILNGMKADLKLWTEQVIGGLLSVSDFQDLILGQKDELKMIALKEAGLAEIAVDKFKEDVFKLISTTITAFIP